jgi:hypothetical protein
MNNTAKECSTVLPLRLMGGDDNMKPQKNYHLRQSGKEVKK